ADLLEGARIMKKNRALAADQHARTSGVDDHRDGLAGALDVDARDRGGVELLLDVLADPLVLEQQALEVFARRVPTRTPRLRDADAIAERMYFLAHAFAL